MSLRPFWTFFGGKWRIAPKYPAPLHRTIIEPFAGAAGYSLRYASADVVLVEKDPLIAGIWRYLLKVKAREVRALPRLPTSGALADVRWPCEEARNLAGFWITRGAARPNVTASAWMRDPRYIRWSWGEMSIERIASQVDKIRHWELREGDYTIAPRTQEATWFIDPPYIHAGKSYRSSSSKIDFQHLARWCRDRRGQVMVCEQEGADWLPFKPFLKAKANETVNGGKISAEALWTNAAITEAVASYFKRFSFGPVGEDWTLAAPCQYCSRPMLVEFCHPHHKTPRSELRKAAVKDLDAAHRLLMVHGQCHKKIRGGQMGRPKDERAADEFRAVETSPVNAETGGTIRRLP